MADRVEFIASNAQRKLMMERLRLETKKSMAEFVMQWGGVMAHDLIEATPPLSRGSSTWPAQKKAGEQAVQTGIRSVFLSGEALVNSFNSKPRLQAWVRDRVNRGDIAGLNQFLKRLGRSKTVIPEADRSLHFAQRTNKGRVPRHPAQQYYVLRAITGYVKEMQRDVGKLKSGFLTAAYMAGLAPKRIPVWVSRHAEPGIGQANFKGPNYFVELTDKARGSSDKSTNELITPVMRNLEKKMAISLKAITGNWRSKYGTLRGA